MPLASTTGDAVDVALIVFLVLVGLAMAYAFFRLGTLFAQTQGTIMRTEEELLPVIHKTGGTVDRVNRELDKIDVITTSAVDTVTTVDKLVRTVSAVITAPVQALAGIVDGLRHGLSSLRTTGSVDEAMQTGRDAAARRVADLSEDLDQAGKPEQPAKPGQPTDFADPPGL